MCRLIVVGLVVLICSILCFFSMCSRWVCNGSGSLLILFRNNVLLLVVLIRLM